MTSPPSSFPADMDRTDEPPDSEARKARLKQWIALAVVFGAGLLGSLVIFNTAQKAPPPIPAWMSPPPASRAAPAPPVPESRVTGQDGSLPATPVEKPLTQQASGSLAPPAPSSAAPPSEQNAGPAAGRFGLQLGVFDTPANAEMLRRKLEQGGVPVFIETRVQAGPFATRAEADAARVRLKALGIADSILLTENKK
ncbi:MAG: hypothetical protein CVU17_06455 [Betaproteobacteria bacterium HGW-Betaproteobacteria-11]|nr:MAG: hypothetical protein CVU17_06455 [Betaproteobacteria bacterium HGW-Betaproteobacteria-11]